MRLAELIEQLQGEDPDLEVCTAERLQYITNPRSYGMQVRPVQGYSVNEGRLTLIPKASVGEELPLPPQFQPSRV